MVYIKVSTFLMLLGNSGKCHGRCQTVADIYGKCYIYEVEERIKPGCKIPYCRFLNCEISTGVCFEMKFVMFEL